MVVVRQVWQNNLVEEFRLIQRCADEFRFVSMDTEFPGTVFSLDLPKHAFSSLSPAHHYSQMKENVDALNIIQLGLTLSDSNGNLPRLGTRFQHVWEFNFCDFDADRDLCNRDSISLLRSQGIDFSKNKRRGIHSRDFAWCFLNSKLGPISTGRAWVTFHGLYDFGFLVKILTGKPLPHSLRDFMMLLRFYFGAQVYDLKPIAHAFGHRGGLEKLATSLGLGRAAGKSHQAGSDSLLTMHAFLRLVMKNCNVVLRFNYILYGLTCKI
ncbi:Polynucleotidyl transferase [Perilla frutescens var. hirtella]|uniref:poly(A)-specific ribonuclease n=1 Tax=Perilla frutescens var. hirtella TaxID=608512 RepID=A0AAD4JHP2_PERFH|nr:Polynucleotidyl transferase [Perilla frutescens var. hirtella]